MNTKLILLLLPLFALPCLAHAHDFGDAETALNDLREDLQSQAARRQAVRADYLARFEADCRLVDARWDLARRVETVAGHLKDLEELGQDVIAGKLEPDAVDSRGRGVLHILADLRTEEQARGLCFNIAKALLSQGAGVDKRDNEGWTPLQRIASRKEQYSGDTALRDRLYLLLSDSGADELSAAPNGKTAKQMHDESLAYDKYLEKLGDEAAKRDAAERRRRDGLTGAGGPL